MSSALLQSHAGKEGGKEGEMKQKYAFAIKPGTHCCMPYMTSDITELMAPGCCDKTECQARQQLVLQ